MQMTSITKRNGDVVAFEPTKITAAIAKAGGATGEFDGREARRLTVKVLACAEAMHTGSLPDVEEIQDILNIKKN